MNPTATCMCVSSDEENLHFMYICNLAWSEIIHINHVRSMFDLNEIIVCMSQSSGNIYSAYIYYGCLSKKLIC